MLDFLSYFSKKIWNRLLYQHIFFFVATVLTVLLMGYYFGTFDQASHIPFLKKYADLSLFPNDHFFDLRNYHYSFFWLSFIPLSRLGILETSMFIIHFSVTYLTFWTIWRLSKTLFNNPLTSTLAILAFIIPHIGFSGLPILEFSLLNRTFVFPFLLLIIDLYLRKNYFLAFLIIGLMYNLHVVSVNFVLAMFAFDQIIRIKQTGFLNLLKRLLVFVLTASPVLIWKFSNSVVDVGLNRQWFEIINKGILAHMLNLLSFQPFIMAINLGGLSAFISFFLTAKKNHSNHNQTLTNFIFAAGLILIIQVIASVWLPLTIIVQSQITRVGVFVTFFAYLFFCHYVSRSINKKRCYYSFMLVAGLVLSISPVLLPFIWLVNEKKIIKIVNVLVFFIFLSFFSLSYITLKLGVWKPGINIFPVKDENYQVQLWAKNNTPKNALFITPPHLWWFYSLEWRVVSERSTVSTLSELLEAAFFPSYISYWRTRFNDVAPGALEKFQGNAFENFKITKQAFYSLSEKQFERIAKKYNASYLVVEKPYFYSFRIVYQNRKFIVYEL